MKRGASSAWMLVGLWALSAVGGALSWWVIRAQTANAAELARSVRRVEAAVLAADWGEAAARIHEVRTAWERTRRRWALHTEHQEMDEVTDALVEAEALIAVEDPTALAALRRARDRIVTLPERDRLDLENLL